ncbi:uncharacterized protein FOMMEDRAFT_82134 [Fomitiporia mediterranea MF3/22]|uniref:uncharacterized protein n=1 Tax=Fomitiporia mediterranea (strain MF3/22) TaxID=694068 RepID=UPI00044094E3|nr:uncharacterized protein FOMMEDRAFT_82134 [Fomitiporia mediterranea MF3/22]EJD03541.1 hypothetical protein FOMMEDRAFT_82134 [Fomitiporia mediterranea MF3/22]
MDGDMIRVWHMVQELSEQLAHNQKLIATLQSQANSLKDQAIHNGSGYALRRFNVDLSQEVFDSELERTNAQMIIENQTLNHENRQLGMLLKEYEQTLETVMSKFRSHALAAQQHELTMTRHYESLLVARESSSMNSELSNSTQTNASLQRLAQSLRLLLRSLAGEDTESAESSKEGDERPLEELAELIEDDERQDWAVEREAEIARLEKENDELRRMLGIDSENAQRMGWGDESPDHRPILHILKATMANASPQEGWGQRSPPQMQPFNAGPVPGNAAPVSQQTIPLQRTIEFQPGMRAAGTLRRPSMLRGRGSAPFWNQSAPADRNWLQGGGGLDLAG